MQVLSVNVSEPKLIEYAGQQVATGIFKEPVDGRVALRGDNFVGDGQADLKVHGGPYKAVYVYPHEHYATWMQELGHDDFSYGQFGENLTITGLLETDVYVGNTYRIGDAVLQVTQPRVPCFKLGIKMGDPRFVKRFMQAQRTGWYMRIVEAGDIGAGDAIILLQKDPNAMSVKAINHLLYFDQDPALAAQALKIEALAPGWQGSLREIVAANAPDN